MKLDYRVIVSETKKAGLDLVSLCGVEALTGDKERLAAWQESGYAAEMRYMLRPPDLLAEPLKIAPWARTILVFALYYDRAALPAFVTGAGRVARYAWGRDYHKVIKKRLEALMKNLRRESGSDLNYRVFSDAVPLLERAVARRAGLGFAGKNSMLIRPKSGSYFFLAEVLTDLEISKSIPIVTENCGTCEICKTSCPTGAIVADGVVDGGKCISYLTIEKRGMLNLPERQALGEWVFGCDICQEVCPFNHRTLKSREPPTLEEFKSSQGAGGLLDLAGVLSIREDRDFIRYFGGTALMRAGREGLLRNAAVVAANTSADAVLPALEEAFYGDRSAVVRAHAFWALISLSRQSGAACDYIGRISDRAAADCAETRDELHSSNADSIFSLRR